MGSNQHVEADLTFLSFGDHAARQLAERVPTSDPQASLLVLLLYRLNNAVTYDLEAAVHRPAGWSWPGFRLLFTLWMAGPLEAKRAAELSGHSRAAVSALANTLTEQGLVRRTPHAGDGRSVVLALTESGQRQLTDAFAEHHEREQAWLSALSRDERTTLISLLSKLADVAQEPWVRQRH
jgi:DNA-binding MarR family transcriptional regulator